MTTKKRFEVLNATFFQDIFKRLIAFFILIIGNPYSWHTKYNLLFIDNPVGAGFSYTDPDGYCRNITQVGDHLYIGLKQFFELFPWLQQSDFFITGESFAGKYIPAIGNAIWEGNKEEDFIINLQVQIIHVSIVSMLLLLFFK